MTTALFPLVLSPFETYMVLDDRPGHPMSILFCLDFDGEFRVEALRAALSGALALHPLLRARVVRRRGRLWWVPVDRPELPLHVGAADAPLVGVGEGLELEERTGVQGWLRQGAGRARLVLEVHHACADAIGVLQFLGDVLAAYDARVRSECAVPPRPVDPLRLRLRSAPPPALPGTAAAGTAAWIRFAVTQALKWLWTRPTPLEPPGTAPAGGAEGWRERGGMPGLRWHTFTRGDTAALRARSRSLGTTLNDVLLRDLFRAVDAWNGLRAGGAGGPIRIGMPQDLRHPALDGMPAANAVGFAFLTRRRDEVADPVSLLAGVREETAFIRSGRVGWVFNQALAVVLRIPGLTGWVMRESRCNATAVLSNVGDVARHLAGSVPLQEGRVRAGDVVLTRAALSPPVRPGTRVVLLAAELGGELTLTARFDQSLFGPDAGQAFLDRYVETLLATARGPEGYFRP